MKVKYLILGAGISGLSLAKNLQSDYLIIEKDKQVGGYCKTFYQDGFIWDYAGHFFHFKDNEAKEYFSKVLNTDECFSHQKKTYIFYKDKLIDYPFQKNIHQLDKDEFIDCLYDLFFKESKENYNSFKDMLLGKFGKSISDRFLIPYNEKLYACDLNDLDTDAMGRFFPYASVDEIIKNMKSHDFSSYNDTFLYPKNGAVSIINHLYNCIDKNNLHLNEIVLKIDSTSNKVITDRDIYEYEYLINTIPFNHYLDLSGYSNYVKNNLSWNKVLVLNLGFDRDSLNKSIHWIYFPDKKVNFYRVGFYNNILMQTRLSLYVEIGFAANEKIDVPYHLEETLKNLKACGITDEHKLISWQHIIMDPAYVHVSKRGSEFFDGFRNNEMNNNVYFIGRYGSWTYCSMEDCYLDAVELANKLLKLEE